MNLLDMINRTETPAPWSEGEKIPWDDPGFSERMLKEHLSQEHDMASRRSEKIDAHVRWIHHHVLSDHTTRILDLGCGPGLYASRLARLGHECVGIDFSPASIAYAEATAQREGLQCTYVQHDIRTAEYAIGFGLAMLVFGEFNVFRPADAEAILRKMAHALRDGGTILLEVSTFDSLKRWGESGTSWDSAPSGLFSNRPHVNLTECSWDADQNVVTTRFYVVDAETGDVTRYAMSTQAYTDEQLRSLLVKCGYTDVVFFPSLTGGVDESQRDLLAIVARKQGGRTGSGKHPQ